MPKDPTDDLPRDERVFERQRPLAHQKQNRRERDARVKADRIREREAKVWRRDLAAYVKADPYDNPFTMRLATYEGRGRMPDLAEAVHVARRKAAADVRAAWFALGEAALAAGASPRVAGFSGRTIREAAMAFYWKTFLVRAAEIGLLPDDAVSPAAMMAWLKPQLPEGWRYNKVGRTRSGRHARGRSWEPTED